MSIYIYPNKRRGFQVQPTKPSLCADTTIPWDLGTSSEGSLVACWGRESGPKKQKEEVEKVNLYGNFTLGTGSFSEWSHECSQPLLHLLTALFWALLQNSTFTPIVNIKSLREVVSFFFWNACYSYFSIFSPTMSQIFLHVHFYFSLQCKLVNSVDRLHHSQLGEEGSEGGSNSWALFLTHWIRV